MLQFIEIMLTARGLSNYKLIVSNDREMTSYE